MVRKALIPIVFLTFLVSLMVSCYRALPPAAKPIEEPSRDIAIARLNITVVDADGNVGGAHCTAFKVGEGLLATAGHCCDEPLAAYTLVGRHATARTAAVRLYSTETPDVCILSGDIEGEPLKVAFQDPKFGDPVWTVGYPSHALLMSDGRWTGRDEDGDGMTSVVVIGGASGSPVLNSKHEVIGILVKGDLGRSHNIAYVTVIDHLIKAIMLAHANVASDFMTVDVKVTETY